MRKCHNPTPQRARIAPGRPNLKDAVQPTWRHPSVTSRPAYAVRDAHVGISTSAILQFIPSRLPPFRNAWFRAAWMGAFDRSGPWTPRRVNGRCRVQTIPRRAEVRMHAHAWQPSAWKRQLMDPPMKEYTAWADDRTRTSVRPGIPARVALPQAANSRSCNTRVRLTAPNIKRNSGRRQTPRGASGRLISPAYPGRANVGCVLPPRVDGDVQQMPHRPVGPATSSRS